MVFNMLQKNSTVYGVVLQKRVTPPPPRNAPIAVAAGSGVLGAKPGGTGGAVEKGSPPEGAASLDRAGSRGFL